METTSVKELMQTRAFVQAQVARELTGTPLWMKPESLPILDDLLDRYLRREPRDVETVAEVVGAFVGECLRKPLAAEWEADVAGKVRLRLADGRTLDPVRRARERIERGREASLEAYGKAALAYGQNPDLPPPETAGGRRGLLDGVLPRRTRRR